MAKTRRIFISDIHLSSTERYNASDELRRARFRPEEHQPRLLNFLRKTILGQENEIRDFVLVGDTFDAWVCPPDETPPTFNGIFRSNPEILDALRTIASSGINLYYLLGNHDYDMQKSDLESEIPSIIFQQAYDDPELKLHAEHGNDHVLYNKSHPDIANGLPLGYFITRLTEHLGGYVSRFRDLISYSDDVVEVAVAKSDFFSGMIEAFAERADVKEIVMNGNGKRLSINKIKQMYAPLAKKYNLFEALTGLVKEGELEEAADRLSKRKRYKVVIFGHTHKAKIDRDSFLVRDRIYANTGCWCQNRAHCIMVDANLDEKPSVTLCKVKESGEAVSLETEDI